MPPSPPQTVSTGDMNAAARSEENLGRRFRTQRLPSVEEQWAQELIVLSASKFLPNIIIHKRVIVYPLCILSGCRRS